MDSRSKIYYLLIPYHNSEDGMSDTKAEELPQRYSGPKAGWYAIDCVDALLVFGWAN
jgi:hypothetical protein